MRHVLVGIVLVALGFWGVMSWWVAFGVAMRGLVPIALLLVGMLALLSGVQRMRADGDPGEEDPGYADDYDSSYSRRYEREGGR